MDGTERCQIADETVGKLRRVVSKCVHERMSVQEKITDLEKTMRNGDHAWSPPTSVGVCECETGKEGKRVASLTFDHNINRV